MLLKFIVNENYEVDGDLILGGTVLEGKVR